MHDTSTTPLQKKNKPSIHLFLSQFSRIYLCDAAVLLFGSLYPHVQGHSYLLRVCPAVGTDTIHSQSLADWAVHRGKVLPYGTLWYGRKGVLSVAICGRSKANEEYST